MSRKLFVVAAVVLLAGVAWILLRDGSATEPAEHLPSSPASDGTAREPSPPRALEGAAAAPSSAANPPKEAAQPGTTAAGNGAPSAEVARERTESMARAMARYEAHMERTPPAVDTSKMPQKKGSVDREAIRSGIKAALPEVRDCYEQGLKRDPSLAGRVVVEFEIETKDGKGTITRGEVVGSETNSPFFEACVLQQLSGTSFPAPEGGGTVKVRYPFNFDPGGGFGGEEKP